jgi:hypothetical protein
MQGIKLAIRDEEMIYTLADFGEAILVEDISTNEVCQVDLKEMSEFEVGVYNFLKKES